MADRQIAPGLLAYGSEEQREGLLPGIAAGGMYSAIGISEHTAGSDLAAVQTKASRVDGGWLLSGTKVWTSGAHVAHQVVVLARTSPPDPEHRHDGFSQFLVPCDVGGVRIDPIVLMSGERHFNEVAFTDVFVPDADVLGEIGNGWHQVTAELSFERSGPERILSTAPLIIAAIRALRSGPSPDDRTAADIGDCWPGDFAAAAVGVGGPHAGRRRGRRQLKRHWSKTSAPGSSRSRSAWSPTCSTQAEQSQELSGAR